MHMAMMCEDASARQCGRPSSYQDHDQATYGVRHRSGGAEPLSGRLHFKASSSMPHTLVERATRLRGTAQPPPHGRPRLDNPHEDAPRSLGAGAETDPARIEQCWRTSPRSTTSPLTGCNKLSHHQPQELTRGRRLEPRMPRQLVQGRREPFTGLRRESGLTTPNTLWTGTDEICDRHV